MTLCRNNINRLDNISYCPAYLLFGNLCFGLLPITNIASLLFSAIGKGYIYRHRLLAQLYGDSL